MTLMDREALAYACAELLKSGGDAITEAAFASGWQAARGHYAPKLTFKEAIEKAGDAVEKLVSRGCFPGDSEFDYALEMSAAAFRAAGVQFRDEPNPEPGACQ